MWTWNCFCFDLFSCRTISCSQILQNTWINNVMHLKFWRKYWSVSYLSNCSHSLKTFLISLCKLWQNFILVECLLLMYLCTMYISNFYRFILMTCQEKSIKYLSLNYKVNWALMSKRARCNVRKISFINFQIFEWVWSLS